MPYVFTKPASQKKVNCPPCETSAASNFEVNTEVFPIALHYFQHSLNSGAMYLVPIPAELTTAYFLKISSVAGSLKSILS
jgi:hypothetical protein